MRAWYVVKTRPRKEDWVIACLEHLGVDVYSPRILRLRRDTPVFERVFPDYLFCNLDLSDGLSPLVRWAPGVSYFIGVEGYPSTVPDEMVEHLRRKVRRWNSGSTPGESERYRAPGALAGLDAIFERYMPCRQRVRILLQVVDALGAPRAREAGP